MQSHTFLFLQQFKTVYTNTQICPEFQIVGFAGEHSALVLVIHSL